MRSYVYNKAWWLNTQIDLGSLLVKTSSSTIYPNSLVHNPKKFGVNAYPRLRWTMFVKNYKILSHIDSRNCIHHLVGTSSSSMPLERD